MSDFITLACPSCGGNLAVTNDADRFSCPFCGRSHLVRRVHGQVTLVPIVHQLNRIVSGVDRSASELAIRRLKEERSIVRQRIREWEDDLEYATGLRSRGWAQAIIGGGITAVLVGFAIGCALSRAEVGVGFLVLACVIGAVGMAGLLNVREAARRIARAEKKLDGYYRELAAIEGELEHHFGIVDRR